MSLMYFIKCSLIVCSSLYMIFSFMGYKSLKSESSKGQFECGFNIFSLNKSAFSSQFFLIMVLFLIFDLEVAMMLPLIISESHLILSVVFNCIFIFLLTYLLVMEWSLGMLEWVK